MIRLPMLLISLLSILSVGKVIAQERPKLIVGIVVDQMRYDYLERFRPGFGSDGFNRFLNSGRNYLSANYNYIPTYTAPGHSSIYTGTTPRNHGIISNAWFDRETGGSVVSIRDTTQTAIGGEGKSGQASPHRLLSPTLIDHLRIHYGPTFRAYSVSLKDRGAILPGGFSSNGSFWYDSKSGNMTSSTWYYDSAPAFLTAFNKKNLPERLMEKDWVELYPDVTFQGTTADEVSWEVDVFKENDRSFPHSFANLTHEKKLELLTVTPMGNDLVLEFALTLLNELKSAPSGWPDFLAVSFSSPDYIGHAYGTNAREIQDCYLRLDEQLATLFAALDKQVGKGNYLVFLTADHGASESHGYLQSLGIECGHYREDTLKTALNSFLADHFDADSLVISVSSDQVFLNHEVMLKEGLNENAIAEVVVSWISRQYPFVTEIFTKQQLVGRVADRTMNSLISNGWNVHRSGEVAFNLRPYYLNNDISKGTTHGSGSSYDTHVPMLFYGWNVKPETVKEPVYIIDIAPTISKHLRLPIPPAATGKPLPLN